MLKNKVLVIVEDGKIQDIYTSGDTEVIIADYDDSVKADLLQKKIEKKITENNLSAINTQTGWNYLSVW